MFTQCPQCMTVFRVDANTLARAHGCVSCCQCGATFDSMATLCDKLPAAPFEVLPTNDPAAAPPLLLQPVEHEKPPQQSLFDDDASANGLPASAPSATAEAMAPDDAKDAVPEHPAFSIRRESPRKGSRGLLALCIALALTLLLQLGWAERSTLIRYPAIASTMRSACNMLGCQLPMARDLDQLKLTSRDVRRHPSVEGALMISASVRNNAPFRQPWPVISIELSDLNDQPVAMRRFHPAEYLHDEAMRKSGLAPRTTAALVFEVVDPGQDAVAFQFTFQ